MALGVVSFADSTLSAVGHGSTTASRRATRMANGRSAIAQAAAGSGSLEALALTRRFRSEPSWRYPLGSRRNSRECQPVAGSTPTFRSLPAGFSTTCENLRATSPEPATKARVQPNERRPRVPRSTNRGSACRPVPSGHRRGAVRAAGDPSLRALHGLCPCGVTGQLAGGCTWSDALGRLNRRPKPVARCARFRWPRSVV